MCIRDSNIGDARVLLSEDNDTCDALLIDAFASKFSIPVHLATKEAFAAYRKTAGDGVLVMNIISSVDGKKSEVFRSISSTARGEFPYQVAMRTGNSTKDIQNVVLIASATPFGEEYLGKIRATKWAIAENWEDGTVYTDERASIDYAMMNVLE